MSNNHDFWPYSYREYAQRIIWKIVCVTVWPFAWKRLCWARPLILRAFGARISLNCEIDGSVEIFLPAALKIGESCAIGPRTNLYNLGGLELGERVVISQDVHLCGGTHDYTKSSLPLMRKMIRIENDAWVCAGAFIGPGVKIGEGAVVGARAVVMKDVEPWSVVAGNPARFIKKRTIEDLVKAEVEHP